MIPHKYTSGPRYKGRPGPHLLLAVDPGRRKMGMALAEVDTNGRGRLVKCSTYTTVGRHGGLAPWLWLANNAGTLPAHVVSERPMAYENRRDAADNCIELQELVDSMHCSEVYTPGQWKGNAPKRVIRRRTKEALYADELALMPSEDEHDAWDAAGILLYALGRVGHGCVKEEEGSSAPTAPIRNAARTTGARHALWRRTKHNAHPRRHPTGNPRRTGVRGQA